MSDNIRKGCLVRHRTTDSIGFVMSTHEKTYKVRWQGVLCDDGRYTSETPHPYYSYAYEWDVEHYHDYDI